MLLLVSMNPNIYGYNPNFNTTYVTVSQLRLLRPAGKLLISIQLMLLLVGVTGVDYGTVVKFQYNLCYC